MGPTASQAQKSHLETYVAGLPLLPAMEMHSRIPLPAGIWFLLLLRPPGVKGKLFLEQF